MMVGKFELEDLSVFTCWFHTALELHDVEKFADLSR